jgi:hypothetical protein
VRFYYPFAHAAIGRIGRPAFPAPFDWKGGKLMANLGQTMPRECEVVFSKKTVVIIRESG